MTITSFFKLVEIQTKVASLFPFLLGTSYVLHRYGGVKHINLILMLVAMLAFDMTTTAINNYYDYKKAVKKYGYGYEIHNAIVQHKLKEGTVIATIMALLAVATVFGVLLFLRTDIIVLLLGMLSFAIGITYSFGPVPISRTPLGELMSGLFMGFIIVFIAAYIHVYDKGLIVLLYDAGLLNIRLELLELLKLFFVSVPMIVSIANIMLANNICDIEDDIENKRYTLPIYIGRENAVKVWKWLYYMAYLNIGALVVLEVLPYLSAIALVTFLLVNKNIEAFSQEQIKSKTFVLSVKNFIIISAAYVGTLALSFIL